MGRPPALFRATLTLLAGGALAQVLPLLLGPWLTRLYTPADFGHYTVFLALAANVAVVACARYDFALPLASDDAEARDLLALCVRVLAAVTLVCVPLALVARASGATALWAWLPATVAVAGAAQCLSMWASRAQRFPALSVSRVTQFGGGAALQVAAGLAQAGPAGLAAGPVAAGAVAAAWLLRPAPLGGWAALWRVPRSALATVARHHRDFPLLNTPHAFLGALQDTLAVLLLAAWAGDAAVGFWGLALRYLKAPATLVGGAVSQALYPQLAQASPEDARHLVRRVILWLALAAAPLVGVLLVAGPPLFAAAFGEDWRGAGELARALAVYIGVHFVASPLGVVTLAWRAQGWALKVAFAGQAVFLASLAIGLQAGGLLGGAWAVSAGMALFFGAYFVLLARWKEVPHAAVA